MGYENALWELDKLPSFLQTDEVSVRTIVQRHNLVCGELLATLERDMRISAESSPRSWGCFRGRVCHFDPQAVFPTLVGVFPRLNCA